MYRLKVDHERNQREGGISRCETEGSKVEVDNNKSRIKKIDQGDRTLFVGICLQLCLRAAHNTLRRQNH